jgi:bacterial/archaeal transporter family protein
MQSWLIYSVLVILFWGFWAFLPRIAHRTLDTRSVLFFQQMGALAATLVLLFAQRFKLQSNWQGIGWAVLTGILGVLGLFCYLQASSQHKLSVVVIMTALYPVLTVTLSIIVLRERLTPLQFLGILFAAIAIVLLSWPTKKIDQPVELAPSVNPAPRRQS